MAHKLGLRKHIPSEKDIQLTSVYKPRATLPTSYGASGLEWGELGNATWGDCYWASSAHETMAEAHLSGRNPQFSEEHVLDSYAKYLGLKSGSELNESNDQGTDAREGAKFRHEFGVEDASGHDHKIGAYTFIEEKNYNLIKSAVYDFEGVTVCVELPESAEEVFSKAEQGEGEYIWDYVSGSKIAGGHAIAGVNVKEDKLYIVSWGHEVEMTEAFIDHYLQTVVVYISGSALSGGKTVEGLDVAALKEALKSV